MTTFEGNPRNNPEARRIALQERLDTFQRAVTKGVVVDETQDAEVNFTRTLRQVQIPKELKALLFVTGATSQNLRLKYAFAQGVNWKMQGIFYVAWDAKVENDDKPRKDQDSDIKSIVFYVSEGKDWEVEFDTNDKGSYVAYDEGNNLLKYEHPQLCARLKASNEILTDQDYRLTLQEKLVSLLDPADPSATLDIRTAESDSYRQTQEEKKKEAEIAGMVKDLMAGAKEILGKE